MKNLKNLVVLIFVVLLALFSTCSKEPAENENEGYLKITASAGSNGSIEPKGVVLVNYGADTTFTITPNSGYMISDVKVDGVSQGAIALYTFEKVTKDHTITATFEAISIYESEMVYVPAGSFEMGDNFGEGRSNELPVHTLYLDAYYIGKYEVTNDQYCQFLNEKGNQTEGGVVWLDIGSSHCLIEYSGGIYKPKSGKSDHPVVEVSWYGARAYCSWLKEKTGKNYRLPTEAEWEKAARGTDQRRYPWGDNIDGNYANYENSGDPYETGSSPWTTPVGFYDGKVKEGFSTHSNASFYGAFDMAGNVFEWCSDWHGGNYYATSPPNNPPGPSSGSYRVLRGGSWVYITFCLRSANRYADSPTSTIHVVGFRCLRD